MIDFDILITGGIGVITTIVGSASSYVFAKKKYDVEVDKTIISNMQESLEFYKRLSDDNKSRLDEALTRADRLEDEIRDVRKQIIGLMSIICTDLSCQMRKREDNNNLKAGK